jgi:hypothetical protein
MKKNVPSRFGEDTVVTLKDKKHVHVCRNVYEKVLSFLRSRYKMIPLQGDNLVFAFGLADRGHPD